MYNITEFLTQSYGKLAYADIAMIIVYMLICLYIGARSAGNITNLKQYALGSGSISTTALVATMYATHLGAGSTIGILEKIAELGPLLAILLIVVSPIQWLLAIFIFAKNIEQFRGCIAVTDIMGRLYGEGSKMLTCIIMVISEAATIAAQAVAFSYCIQYFLGLSFAVGVIIGIVTIVFYSALGGVRAVVVTDVLQFAIFYAVIPLICGAIVQKTGGWEAVTPIMSENITSIAIKDYNWMPFLWCAMYYILDSAFIDSAFIQRFLMAGSSKQLSKVLWIVILINISVLCSIGLLGVILSTNVNEQLGTQLALWQLLDDNLFITLKGGAVICIFAIIMSTADSYLNSSSVMIARNIFKSLWPNITDREEVIIARASTVFIGGFSIFLALYGGGILSILWIGMSFSVPMLAVPLASGFLGFRTNSVSFYISNVLAIAGNLIGSYIEGDFGVTGLFFGMIGSTLGLFGTHQLQKALGILGEVAPQEKIELQKWYEGEAIVLGIPVEEVPAELARIKSIREKSDKGKSLNELFAFVLDSIRSFNVRDLVLYSQSAVSKYGEKYYELAAVAVILCVYTLMFAYSTVTPTPLYQSSITLRIFITLCCLSLVMEHWWDEGSRKYMPLYFHIATMLYLPFLATYTHLVHPQEITLAISTLSVFCTSLIVDWYTFCIIVPIGFILGNIAYILASYVFDIEALYAGTLKGTLIYLTIAVVSSFLLRFVENKNTKKLYNMANHDALTGLYNRHYLDAKLDKLILDARTRKKKLSVICIDLNKFKILNDTYGHNIGDLVLKHIANIIQANARPLDTCVRTGGDEFLIVLPCTGIEDARSVASRIRMNVENNPMNIGGKAACLWLSLSIGIAEFEKCDTVESLIGRADEDMYRGKGDVDDGVNDVQVEQWS